MKIKEIKQTDIHNQFVVHMEDGKVMNIATKDGIGQIPEIIEELSRPRIDIPPDYKMLRQPEYISVTDQLDAINKWLFSQTEFVLPAELKAIVDHNMSVKEKYKKPQGD